MTTEQKREVCLTALRNAYDAADGNGLIGLDRAIVLSVIELLEKGRPQPRESRRRLPCPMCGGRRWSWVVNGLRNEAMRIVCDKCGFSGPWTLTQIGAIRAWNMEAERMAKDGERA